MHIETTDIDYPLANAPADFMDELNRIDPLICPRQSLVDLHEVAPTPEIKAFLSGIHNTRKMMAIVTGKEY